MSHKKSKGVGKGGGVDAKEDDWKGFKKEWVECEGDDCGVFVCLRVLEEWKADEAGALLCGCCVTKLLTNEMNLLKEDLTNMKAVNVGLREDVVGLKETCLKMKEENRVLREKSQNVSKSVEDVNVLCAEREKKIKRLEDDMNDKKTTWANIAGNGEQAWTPVELKNKFEKLDGLNEQMERFKRDVRKEVKVQAVESIRDKRMLVFNLKQDATLSEKEQVDEMMAEMGVEMIKVCDVERMRPKMNVEANEGETQRVRPVIVEFKTSFDKWKVLENKSVLRGSRKYSYTFLEADMSKEQRVIQKEKYMERKNRGTAQV